MHVIGECSVCSKDLDNDDPNNRPLVPTCGHVIHELCLEFWFEYLKRNDSVKTCPDCRKKIDKRYTRRLFLHNNDDNQRGPMHHQPPLLAQVPQPTPQQPVQPVQHHQQQQQDPVQEQNEEEEDITQEEEAQIAEAIRRSLQELQIAQERSSHENEEGRASIIFFSKKFEHLIFQLSIWAHCSP